MIKKKVYYGKAIYGKEEINASIKVLRNSSLSLMDGNNVKKLEKKGLLAIGFGTGLIRMVTHLDFNDDQMEKAIQIFKTLE